MSEAWVITAVAPSLISKEAASAKHLISIIQWDSGG